jgi:hypothetical protein
VGFSAAEPVAPALLLPCIDLQAWASLIHAVHKIFFVQLHNTKVDSPPLRNRRIPKSSLFNEAYEVRVFDAGARVQVLICAAIPLADWTRRQDLLLPCDVPPATLPTLTGTHPAMSLRQDGNPRACHMGKSVPCCVDLLEKR